MWYLQYGDTFHNWFFVCSGKCWKQKNLAERQKYLWPFFYALIFFCWQRYVIWIGKTCVSLLGLFQFPVHISKWCDWTRDCVYTETGWWLFAKKSWKWKSRPTSPGWVFHMANTFRFENRKCRITEVSVTLHVYKNEDKKICFAGRRQDHTLSLGIDSWRQLGWAENNKINKK